MPRQRRGYLLYVKNMARTDREEKTSWSDWTVNAWLIMTIQYGKLLFRWLIPISVRLSPLRIVSGSACLCSLPYTMTTANCSHWVREKNCSLWPAAGIDSTEGDRNNQPASSFGTIYQHFAMPKARTSNDRVSKRYEVAEIILISASCRHPEYWGVLPRPHITSVLSCFYFPLMNRTLIARCCLQTTGNAHSSGVRGRAHWYHFYKF